jgi:glycosyltransferase involved in cell wall biosynthesis
MARLNDVAPEQVAHLCKGAELYGIGSVQRFYAGHVPGLLFVCFSRGALYEWLIEHRHRVILLRDVAAEAPVFQSPRRFAVDGLHIVRNARRLRDILDGEGIRILHSHRVSQNLTAALLRRAGYKVVWQIHNNMNVGRGFGLGLRLNNRIARAGADLLLPVSDYIAAYWKQSAVPYRTIRNAASPLLTGCSAMPAGPLRCLTAGRLHESKGHHLAVDAVMAAREAGHDVTLDIFGGPLEDNGYVDRMRRRIDAGGHAAAFRFMGFRTNIRELHPRYALGLQCRINPEPCSVWVCETLVDGLPLIASATGGTPELVKDGETGLLFEPGDSADLARKLITLAGNRDRLAAMRQAAFDRGQSHHLPTRFIDETFDAYRTLVDAEK